MLVQTDLLGVTRDKVADAISRLKAFEPPEGYYLAFSGGKDSVVVKALADMAGVKYDAYYSVTTVDPPELVRFIVKQHPDVIIEKPRKSMWKLIVQKRTPPTRLMRYCCEYLKELHGEGRVTLTGVRRAESANRKNNHGLVTIMNAKKSKMAMAEAEANGAIYQPARGGVVLNYDDAPTRRTVEHCYRTAKTLVNPIIDWEDDDVWEFIRRYKIPYCALYDEGMKRLGCIGCPLGGYASQKREFARWPGYKKLYIRAFDEMLKARQASGKDDNDGRGCWTSGQAVFDWWVGDLRPKDDAQFSLFCEEEDE